MKLKTDNKSVTIIDNNNKYILCKTKLSVIQVYS